jgi:hypothetical protein
MVFLLNGFKGKRPENQILSLEPSRFALGRREWGMALALTGKGWEWVG